MDKINKCYCCNKEVKDLKDLKDVKDRLLCEECFDLLNKSMEFLKNIKEA